MKKILSSLIAISFLASFSFATEISIEKAQTIGEQLIQMSDQAIAKGSITADKLIIALQTIHENQKSQIQKHLSTDNKIKAQKVLSQRENIYDLTNHLYDLKMGSGITIDNSNGDQYTFLRQSKLNWLNIQRGDENYYRFPTKDSFLEIDFTFNQTGAIKQETQIEKSYPTYFYDGGNYLADLTQKNSGSNIKELNNTDSNQYLFYDLTDGTITNTNTKLSIDNGGNVNLNQIYNAVSYSPSYFLTSLDEGFQYCQKVSKRLGEEIKDKEFSAKECSEASKGNFNKNMNKWILEYALNNI